MLLRRFHRTLSLPQKSELAAERVLRRRKEEETVALQSKCNNLEAQLVDVNIPDAQDPTDEEIYRALQNPKTFETFKRHLKDFKTFKRSLKDL